MRRVLKSSALVGLLSVCACGLGRDRTRPTEYDSAIAGYERTVLSVGENFRDSAFDDVLARLRRISGAGASPHEVGEAEALAKAIEVARAEDPAPPAEGPPPGSRRAQAFESREQARQRTELVWEERKRKAEQASQERLERTRREAEERTLKRRTDEERAAFDRVARDAKQRLEQKYRDQIRSAQEHRRRRSSPVEVGPTSD